VAYVATCTRHSGGLRFLRYRRPKPPYAAVRALEEQREKRERERERELTNYFRVYKINEESAADGARVLSRPLLSCPACFHARGNAQGAHVASSSDRKREREKERERERERETASRAFLNVFAADAGAGCVFRHNSPVSAQVLLTEPPRLATLDAEAAPTCDYRELGRAGRYGTNRRSRQTVESVHVCPRRGERRGRKRRLRSRRVLGLGLKFGVFFFLFFFFFF